MENRDQDLAKKHLLLALNNIKAYVKKFDLIPVEYRIEGKEGNHGLFVPRSFTDQQIKKVISGQVKLHGGRWLGKFTIPEDAERLINLMAESIDKKVDKGKVLQDFNQFVSKNN